MNHRDPIYLLAAAVAAPVWLRKSRDDWSARCGKTDRLPESDRPVLTFGGMDDDEARERAKSILDRVGLEGRPSSRPDVRRTAAARRLRTRSRQ